MRPHLIGRLHELRICLHPEKPRYVRHENEPDVFSGPHEVEEVAADLPR